MLAKPVHYAGSSLGLRFDSIDHGRAVGMPLTQERVWLGYRTNLSSLALRGHPSYLADFTAHQLGAATAALRQPAGKLFFCGDALKIIWYSQLR
jgi:hypothetical protein